MNKDVIYIEPEDDITDIISRVKSSSQRVVALVPPKKLGVLRSAINIKLLARTAKQSEKAVVLVTADPSLVKLAASVSLPVAKTLQSRPVIPKLSSLNSDDSNSRDIETLTADEEEKSSKSSASAPSASKSSSKSTSKASSGPASRPSKDSSKDADIHLNSADVEEEETKKAPKKKSQSALPNFDKYRKFIIAGVILLLGVAGFLVWAIGFSGAADITVKIRTSASSFAETVSLVTSEANVNIAEGKLPLEKVEYEKESSVEFEATGEKDFGNKASGIITVQASSISSISINIPAGTEFYTSDLTFVSTADAILTWDGQLSTCESISARSCVTSTTVNLIAAEGGTKYNIPADQLDWTTSLPTIPGFHASNATAFMGGSTEIAKVISAEDIDKAKSSLTPSPDGKDILLDGINKETTVIIDGSYTTKTADPVSSVTIGEKADKAKLTAKTTYSIFVVSRSLIDQYIKTAVGSSLGSDQTVYEIGSPFFERFVETADHNGYTAKLKSTIKSGPEVTEADILEKVRGKKIGEVQSLLQSINGINNVSVKTPYPWVRSVPEDASKVTIKIEVES